MNTANWHQRFLQQAGWTKSARHYCLEQIQLPSQSKILEIGSGTGAVLAEFSRLGTLFGVDIDRQALTYSKSSTPNLFLNQSDGYALPFVSHQFDLSFCHYLLLWVKDPLNLLREMIRATKPGGWICCFAEPDYDSRIDHPTTLSSLGKFQNLSLKKQGVSLNTGRYLTEWLSALNLTNIQSGVLGGHWVATSFDENQWKMEWEMIFHDLQAELDPQTLYDYKIKDLQSSKNSSRVLFIPTFYAWGQVPDLSRG